MASCFVKKGSDGPYVMTWHRNGQEVKDNARVKTSVKATGTTIAIDGIRVEDVANYTCTATNAEGSDTVTLPLVVAGGPPDLREFSFPSEVALGEEILVGCFVKKGTAGPYRITWLKDGKEIRESERVTITARSKTSAALRISSIRAEDVANYTCVASNDYGTDSVTAPLIINDIPKIQEFKFPANLSPGETALVGCIVSKGSAGPYELSWWKDGVPLTHDSSRTSVMSHKGGPVSTLTIVDVSASDSGNYTCVARNAAGSDSFSAFLAVTGTAEIILFDACSFMGSTTAQSAGIKNCYLRDTTRLPGDVSSDVLEIEDHNSPPGAPRLQSAGFPNELSLGEETVATCFVKKGSAGPYALAWQKEGEPVRNSDRVVVTVKSTSTALSIDGVQVEDIGNYTCSATNSAGTDALTLPLLISAPPSIRRFSFPPEIALGEEVIVACSVKKGSTSDSYSIGWQKDGRTVAETGRVSTSSRTKGSATLLIASLEPDDVGNYTCTARNAFGSDSFTAQLVVNDAPKINEFKFPANLSPGDTVAVNCVIKNGGAGPFELLWLKNDHPLEPTASLTVTSPKGGPVSTLSIVDVSARDSGNYTCVARNVAGSDRYSAHLAVTVLSSSIFRPPKPNSLGFPSGLGLGDDAVASCFVPRTNWPGERLRITWTRENGADLSLNRRVSLVRASESSVTLGIRDIRPEDIGNYTCVVPYGDAAESISVPLVMSASPKLRQFAFPPEVTLGEQVLVSCAVRSAATGPHRMTWLKDGKEIENSERISVTAHFKGTAALVIADLRPEDVGNYTCVASNDIGSDSFTAALVVQGKVLSLYGYFLGCRSKIHECRNSDMK
ncbi:hypothetical protein MRX96_050896 [Rhipicephalus microplus]